MYEFTQKCCRSQSVAKPKETIAEEKNAWRGTSSSRKVQAATNASWNEDYGFASK